MLLFEHDLNFLLASVERVVNNKKEENNDKIIFVEIGLNEGKTAEQLIPRIASLIGIESFDYYGIDPVKYQGIYPTIKFINKPSHLAINEIPNPIDWVFVDGCHCAKCVIKDFVLYGSRLRIGGEICFHDASPLTQGRDPQNYPFMDDYHDVDVAKKGIAVRDVLDKIVKRTPFFELINPSLNQEYGGVETYKRVFT